MAEPRRAAATVPRFEGGRFLIVEARYYEAIGADLLAGATQVIEAAGAAYDLVSVAGALEIPAGMAIALDAAKATGRPYDGAVALGCVVRGETFHFDIVAGESARALMDMSVDRRLAPTLSAATKGEKRRGRRSVLPISPIGWASDETVRPAVGGAACGLAGPLSDGDRRQRPQ
jgi:6,7-dimethyl-8-ribityllumazine synthase